MTAALACSLACLLFSAFAFAMARRSSTDCPRTVGARLSPVVFGDNSGTVEAMEGEVGRTIGLTGPDAFETVEGIRIESNSLAP